MIHDKELRLGNFISLEGVPLPVHSLQNNEIGTFEKGFGSRWYRGEAYDPIPLNEEWLSKLGFKTDTDTRCWYTKRKWHIYQNTIKDDVLDVGFYWGEAYLKIETVHKLQNLYYVLTGDDLTINE